MVYSTQYVDIYIYMIYLVWLKKYSNHNWNIQHLLFMRVCTSISFDHDLASFWTTTFPLSHFMIVPLSHWWIRPWEAPMVQSNDFDYLPRATYTLYLPLFTYICQKSLVHSGHSFMNGSSLSRAKHYSLGAAPSEKGTWDPSPFATFLSQFQVFLA